MLLLLSLGGCYKAQVLGEYYLGGYYFLNPYQGYEKLVYVTSDETDIEFYGEGRYSTIHKGYVSVNSNDHYLWESDIVHFTTLDGQYKMHVYMQVARYESSNYLSIAWRDNHSDTAGYIRAGTGNNLPLSPDNLMPQNKFLDSLCIRENVYYDVYVDSAYARRGLLEPIDSSFVYPTIIYYNTTNGILKLDFNNNSTWELSHIEN